jgi:hypothetical protein
VTEDSYLDSDSILNKTDYIIDTILIKNNPFLTYYKNSTKGSAILSDIFFRDTGEELTSYTFAQECNYFSLKFSDSELRNDIGVLLKMMRSNN